MNRATVLGVCAAMLAVILMGRQAEARPVHYWTIPEIAEKADVIVIGEVTKAEQTGTIAKEDTGWKVPLLKMQAEVRVIRTYPAEKVTGVIRINYHAIDWSKCGVVVNGPQFPSLEVGDVRAMPLYDGYEDAYRFISEEDFNMIMPAVAAKSPGEPAETAEDFLMNEFAGVFALGSFADVYRGALYLRDWRLTGIRPEQLFDRLRERIEDRDRWMEVAVATYTGLPPNRPRIADLLVSDETWKKSLEGDALFSAGKSLARMALKQAGPPADVDDQVIRLTIRHAPVDLPSAARTLSLNYPTHPRTIRILKEGLAEGNRAALYLANEVITDKDDPLLKPALEVAKRVILDDSDAYREGLGPSALYASTRLIREFGDEQDFKLLRGEMMKAQRSDLERYKALLTNACNGEGDRAIMLCSLAIDDTRSMYEWHEPEYRFRDYAVVVIQRITGVEFLPARQTTIEERDAAARKVKEWLAENCPECLERPE